VSIGKRLWDVARANAADFARAFGGDEKLTDEDRAELDKELRDLEESVGGKAGRRAREFRRRAGDAAEEAWDRAFEAARARGGPYNTGTGPSERDIDGWYRTLEVPVGASWVEIRRSYRSLVARYHPDRYASDPDKYATATAVTRKITVAYNGLKQHLGEA
jgi:DnaJ-domain-containing protein 1